MSVSNRDASLITKKNRDQALYAYKNQINIAVNSGQTVVLAEQPNTQSGLIVTQRNIGCGVCANISTSATYNIINYEFNPSGSGGATGGAFPGQ
jgi:hypothetical protein